MLFNLIYLLSALSAAGICYIGGGFGSLNWIWLLPLGFVGCFLLCLLGCFLVVWILARRSGVGGEYEQDDPFIRKIVKLYAPAVFRLLGCRIDAAGTEKLPADGRFLLVCNHLQDLDPGVILAALPQAQLAFIAKKEVLGMPILNALMPRLLCQFIDRENDRNALKTILKCISILKEDKANVAVFPEGKITGDNKLHRYRPGVFKIAQKAKVPIVVCTLFGTQNIPGNLRKLRRTHIRFRLLEVIPAADLEGVNTPQIAERVYAIMAADLGPENVAD